MTQWYDFPQILTCKPATVYLIGISLANVTFSDNFLLSLSQFEKEKAAKFKFDIHRERYIMFHACLRDILARYIKTQPELLQFDIGLHKKPYLKNNPALQFNLSHSENEAIVAITLNADVGVDIEKKKTSNMDELAERFFSEAEFAYLNALPTDERINTFYQFWTHKEAFIKATGLGLSQGLKNFTIGLNPSRLLQAHDVDIADWTIQDFCWKDDFASAFAVKQSIEQINYYRYELSCL
jgi:4'-phosphopantetheinyl transferase